MFEKFLLNLLLLYVVELFAVTTGITLDALFKSKAFATREKPFFFFSSKSEEEKGKIATISFVWQVINMVLTLMYLLIMITDVFIWANESLYNIHWYLLRAYGGVCFLGFIVSIFAAPFIENANDIVRYDLWKYQKKEKAKVLIIDALIKSTKKSLNEEQILLLLSATTKRKTPKEYVNTILEEMLQEELVKIDESHCENDVKIYILTDKGLKEKDEIFLCANAKVNMAKNKP